MKILVLNWHKVCGLVVLWVLFAVEYGYAQSCSTVFITESKSGAGSVNKVGFDEFCNNGDLPKKYLTYTHKLDATSSLFGEYHEGEELKFDPDTSDVKTVYNYGKGSEADYIHYQWVNPYYENIDCGPSSYHGYGECLATCDGLPCGYETYNLDDSKSDEYDTGRVKQKAKGKADSDLDSCEWKKVDCPGTVQASASLDKNEMSASITKAKIRFKIPMSDPDTRYVFTWPVHIATSKDGGASFTSLQTQSCSVDGNGGEVISPEQSLDIDIPSAGMTTSKTVNTTEVKVQPIPTGSDSGGGGGGGGGGGSYANGGGLIVSGGGGCSSCGTGGNYKAGAGSINETDSSLNVHLGYNLSGLPVGNMVVSPNNSAPATPAMIQFAGMPGDVIAISNNSCLRQLITAQVLVDIVSNTPSQFDINFYDTNHFTRTLAGGLPTSSNGQFLTWRIENPGGTNDTNNLRMTEIRGPHSIVNLVTWSGNTTVMILANGLKKQVQEQLWEPGGIYRTQITRIYNKDDIKVYSRTDTYQLQGANISDGEILISTVEGTGGSARTTHYSTTSSYQSVSYSDGTGETSYYDFDSHIIESDRGSYKTTYDYTPLANSIDDVSYASDVARTTINYFQGNVIGKQFAILTTNQRVYIQAANPTAEWNDAGNLYTTNNYDANGRLTSVIAPDKTISWYIYGIGTTGRTNTVCSGYWNGSTYITNRINVTVYNPAGSILSATTSENGLVTGQTVYSNYDEVGRVGKITYLDGTSVSYQYDCCGVSSALDRNGVATLYGYNDLKQVTSQTQIGNGSNIWNYNYDPVGNLLSTTRKGDPTIALSSASYNDAGRQTRSINALNGPTTYQEVLDGNNYVRTTTNPDAGTRIETYNSDGQLVSVTGTGVRGLAYSYGTRSDMNGNTCSITTETKLDNNGSTDESTTTFTDVLGRQTEVLYADGSFSRSFYNSLGQLWKQVDADGVTTFYIYNTKGEQAGAIAAVADATKAIDSYTDLVSAFNNNNLSNDRITWTTNDVVMAHGTVVRSTQTFVWLDGQSTGTLTSLSESSADGLQSWQVKYGEDNWGKPVTNSSVTSISGSSRTTISMAPDGSYTISTYAYARLLSSLRYDANGVQLGGSTYAYDAHGRQHQVTDARNGATTYAYNNADLVSAVTTPMSQTTTNLYDTMLRPYSVIQPDGTTVNSVYLLTGELGLQYGSRTYPVAYGYDYAGRLQSMTNWSDFAGQSGARVTTWNYNSQRGWLTQKIYPDAMTGNLGTDGPAYDYWPSGRLKTRTWVRGIATTYAYDNAGSLTNVSYSDSTPAVSYAYDRLGRQISAAWKDNNGSTITDNQTYNLANELLSEVFVGGSLNDLSVTNGYDALLRRTKTSAQSASSQLLSANYSYDAASRLTSVTDTLNNNSATYSYVANSPLVSQITFKQSNTTRMATIKSYDYLNRITQILSAPSGSGSLPATFKYVYNSANQRTKNTLADGSYWVYQYDSLGQVTSGVKYFADGTPVPGQQFGYAFDDIGNRTHTTVGGDNAGASRRLANYVVNNLNQITNRDYPGTNDIVGVALATNTVTVNGQTAWRKGEYFWATVNTNNLPSAQWLEISVASGGVTNAGNLYLPHTPEQFSYDADGNLTNDGRWSYTWDAENRLVQMTVNTNVGPQYQLNFAYDAKGRRIQKVVLTNSVAIYTNKFLYDGWNLVAELKPDNSRTRTYVWGMDLSGSQQGAGGVGGLLEVSYYGSATTNCFPAFDGNGNLAALINAADGTSVANYAYGPFGELVQQTGVMARKNPFRFSTKYADGESDLLYYGYRYYKPSTGTWPNRDPMGEVGGINLYNSFQADPINRIDPTGKNVEGIALLVIVTVVSALIVYTAIELQGQAKHVAEKSIIAGTYHDTGNCKGVVTRDVVGTIKQEPQDVLTQGFSLDVSQIKMFWWPTGGRIQVMVYAIAEVKGNQTGQTVGSRKLVDQWSYPIPADWCCKP